jgi:hypothetical protein
LLDFVSACLLVYFLAILVLPLVCIVSIGVRSLYAIVGVRSAQGVPA